MLHAATWMHLKHEASERNQTQESQIVWFHLWEISRMGELIESENSLGAQLWNKE